MTSNSTPGPKTNQDPTLKEKTAKGLFWGGIGNGFQQIVQLIFGIIMLHLLNSEDYGIVGMLAIFSAIALIIQDSGFSTALVNKKEIRYEDYNAVFWFSVLSSIISYTFLFYMAPFIASFFERPILIPIARILFLSFLINSFGVAQHAFLVKKLMVKERAKIDIFALTISGIIGIILAYNGYKYWAIIIQNISYMTIGVLARWYYCPWKPTLHINFSPLKKMVSFSINIFFTVIFSKVVENIFSILLGKYYDEKQVGYYTQGNKWSTMGGSFVTGMINSVALPVLTELRSEKERQKNAFRKMLRFGALISFPLMLGLAFIGKEFLLIAGGGDKWVPATPYLQLFCIWNSAFYIWSLYTNVIMTHHKSNIFMWGTILTGTLQLIIVIATFKFGILQMVFAYICIYFAGLLFWHYFTNKLIGLRLWHVIKDIAPYLITAIGSITICWFITKNIDNIYLKFILKIIITSVLYLLIIWKSNSVIVRECYEFIKHKFTT
ncbi:MAG: lipopolysaccharide biosynthesis protein [Tannerella sp.]|nr:lipopolysaccharide biosynthesis protein [Tannerella sp.]